MNGGCSGPSKEQARRALEALEEQLGVLKSWGVTDAEPDERGLLRFEADGNTALEELLLAAGIVAMVHYDGDCFERTLLLAAKAKTFRED